MRAIVTSPADSENTRKCTLLYLNQATNIRCHEKWNSEEEKHFSIHVPTLKASEGAGNGTAMDNLIFGSYRSVHCSSSNPQPSKVMKNGTRKIKIILYVPFLNASEGVGNRITMDNLMLNLYIRKLHCSSYCPQPPEAMRNGTR